MPKMLIETNKEQDEKLKHIQDVFDLNTKKEAVLKLIDLTKITPPDKTKERIEVLKAFGEK